MNKSSRAFWRAVTRFSFEYSAKIIGRGRPGVTRLAPPLSGSKDSLSFVAANHHQKQDLANQCESAIIICDPTVDRKLMLRRRTTIIVTETPRELFAEISAALFEDRPAALIHKSAVISANSRIGRRVSVGANSVLDGAVIGDGCEIGPNCHIAAGVVIGNGVRIKAGAVIGGDGFGYIRTSANRIINMPHIGKVIIEDNVHVGAHATIDRGSLVDTFIGCDSKLDNFVHVSHNAHVGARCLLTAHVVICGSAWLEDDCYCGPSAVIEDGLFVGRGAKIGTGSCVKRSVPSGEVWLGNPAQEIESFMRKDAAVRRLLPPRRVMPGVCGGEPSSP